MSRPDPVHTADADTDAPIPRRLVVMDIDSTFITAEVIELLAGHAGSRAQVAEITERAMRGELDFTESLRARVATLAGLPDTVFAEVLAEVELSPGADHLVAELHRRGWPVGLVSGGFTEVAVPLAARVGVPAHLVRANALEVEHGALTGRVAGEVVDRAVKARTLREMAAAEDVPLERTVAIGDGANDLDMLATAGFGIAYRAKPVLADRADARIGGRLDEVLTLPPFHL